VEPPASGTGTEGVRGEAKACGRGR
jgi:hypothetical protein